MPMQNRGKLPANLQINGRGEEEKMRMEDHIGLIFCQTFLEWRM